MHVNYAKGMVLGVDDYIQEFAYLSGRDRWMARDLIGYGTCSGLAVLVEKDSALHGPRVRIKPGSAVAPSGQMICVERDQCGSLNAWLEKPENAVKVTRRLSGGSPPDEGAIKLHLVLCYRDCAVMPVPVPGEPCRSDDDLMAPSRIADDYTLTLALDPPEQTEWDAVTAFGQWLGSILVEENMSPPFDDESTWERAIKDALNAIIDDPQASPPEHPSSPPAGPLVSRDRYDDFVRLA